MPLKLISLKYRLPTVTPEAFKRGYKEHVTAIKECMGETFPLSIQMHFISNTQNASSSSASAPTVIPEGALQGADGSAVPLTIKTEFGFDAVNVLTFADEAAYAAFQEKFVSDLRMRQLREKELDFACGTRLEIAVVEEVFEVRRG
ncbi:uncharacterized protein DSM5745_08395 [Aspergillus mulundensis]|uniref:EthD domain-containing protein n=1 Tax=Aspergillus mulundensis TaxID=1810919 RepID=A0A3D8RAI9_9EURO|nr:hypothetical protein DSM5745_08395 [Aspergillus mulundensis]RDW70884.1 hypothetical protein DSM5745_08395 [Aspergillus mulundensis]